MVTFLNENPSSSKSPSKSLEPLIIRTLRTTLNATDPQNISQSPVWGLSVLASFVVLLGPVLFTDQKITRVITALLCLTMRHTKSAVRGLGCLVWRCITWAYFQMPHSVESDSEGEDGDENKDKGRRGRQGSWRIVTSVLIMGVGPSTLAAALHRDESDDEDLKHALSVLKAMTDKKGSFIEEAMRCLQRLVSFQPRRDWAWDRFLPPSLFSAIPGLLTVEYGSLANTVRAILTEECPNSEDIRSLTRDEIAREWIFNGLVGTWKEGVKHLELRDDDEIPVNHSDLELGLTYTNHQFL